MKIWNVGFLGYVLIVIKKKLEIWDRVRSLYVGTRFPWICLGDFIEINDHPEKGGGRMKGFSKTYKFQKLISDMGFVDAGFQGPMFT